jgi:glycosyltransferase involved in cell wall biosynthesis
LSARHPTILQLIPRLDTGGAEQATIDIAAAIVKAGGRALVATEGGRLEPSVVAAGGEIVTLPVASKSPLRMWRNAGALARLARREAVTLIHARSRAPAYSGLGAARRLGIPFVATYHGAYAGTSRLKTWYNGVMARGDAVIANSHYTARLIAERHGTDPARIRIIQRGIDPSRFAPEVVAADRMAALRARWGVASGVPVILNAARLTGWKGQRVLIAAAARLAGEGRLGEAVVVLAGDAQGRDGYVEELRATITDAGLGARVVLAGHCDDMPAAFLTAALSVVASTEPEGFGRVTAESLAMGTPVVATDIGAPPETLRLPGNGPGADGLGWIVPPGDPAALAEAMAAALALTAEQRRALAARAIAHVRRDFSLDNMQRQTLALYDELTGSGLEATLASATQKR